MSAAARDVAVFGPYAYVANADSDLRVIDISDTLNPHEVSRFATPGKVNGVCVSASYAYTAGYSDTRTNLEVTRRGEGS